MSRITWDDAGERLYETGVKQGVLYPMANSAYPNGVGWNGLSKITESPSGAEPTKLYANDQKYLELISNEEFGGTIEAYTYPDEFAECDGSATVADGITITAQARKTFGLCYRNAVGNDEDGYDYGYKLHLVYGCKAKPSSKDRATVNDSPEAATMSWEFSTTPVAVTGFKPTAHLVVDSKKVPAAKLSVLEGILYGTNSTATAYAASTAYSVGDYITKESKTYVCIAAVASSSTEFDASKWMETTTGPRLPLPDEVISIVGTAVANG